MPIRNNPNRPVSSVPVSDLKGKAIPQDETKIASTPSHDITLNTDYMLRDGGTINMPDFKLKLRSVEDPNAKDAIIDLPQADIDQIKSAKDFEKSLGKLLKDNKAYLQPAKDDLLETLPEADRSNYAFNNIVGRRNEKFFDEASALLKKANLSGDDAKEARRALNFAHRDAFRGRAIDFDRADTGSYWSYGGDKPFTHVYEKMLAALPEGDPKRVSIQNELDFIYTKKYVTSGKVDENNAEKSMGVIAIDKETRDVVSMTKGSESGLNASYETLKVAADGGEHAGKAVYRDGDKHYFAGGKEEVPADLVAKLESTPANEIVFRKLKDDEKLREDFRFDWNGNRMMDTEKINTGWWGHCDIKATMETILTDMKGSGGVNEFNSASGKTTKYTRADQLEGLASILNHGDGYNVDGQRRPVALSPSEFAGARFDDRPTRMGIEIGNRNLDLQVRVKGLKKGDETLNLEKTFATKIVDDKEESFKDNPDIKRVERGDINFIDGSGMTISGTTDGYSFDEMGRPIESKTPFTIDPNATEGERQLITTNLRDIQTRELERVYYDPATKEVSIVDTQFVKNDDGKYEAKEGDSRVVGTMTGVELGREMTGGDDIEGKLELLKEAIRSGDKMATDSDAREEVWNGEVHRITEETAWRSADGKWERVDIKVDATFGTNKVGTFLHKLDDEGKIIDTAEVKPAVDFYWKDRPRVSPVVVDRGNVYINSAMSERGVVDLGDGMMSSLGAMRDLNDLVYLGLKSKDNEPAYTIVHEGKRLVYDNKADWEADVQKLGGSLNADD